ncbi:MAG: hypothetical protein ABIF77_13925 [bacterium]
MPSVDEIAEAMFKMVERDAGQKKYKPGDLKKAMIAHFDADKETCKAAIRQLVDSGRLVYTYFGGSFLEVPHKEGAAPDED